MLSPAVKIFLCAQATDMRRSFDKPMPMRATTGCTQART